MNTSTERQRFSLRYFDIFCRLRILIISATKTSKTPDSQPNVNPKPFHTLAQSTIEKTNVTHPNRINDPWFSTAVPSHPACSSPYGLPEGLDPHWHSLRSELSCAHILASRFILADRCTLRFLSMISRTFVMCCGGLSSFLLAGGFSEKSHEYRTLFTCVPYSE